MHKNFKLTIEYDGTNYHGWQVQPNGPSVQQEIETAVRIMTRQEIRILGSGRTDAGVHALGQVANFSCRTGIAAEAFHKGLNSLLPEDIVIREIVEVPLQFHARYDAKSKLYRYNILNAPVPSAIERHTSWWIRNTLDVPAMQKAAGHFMGRHDFKAFEGAGSPRTHTVRHIMKAEVNSHHMNHIFLEIQADGFLRYMVRNIAGTLVDVGRHKLSPDDVRDVLASKDRSRAGITAPARGLCLIKVFYD